MRLTPWTAGGLGAGVAACAALACRDTPLRDYGPHGSRPAMAAGATALMAIWWLTEAVPIYVTACVPLVLFPALGVFGKGFAGDVSATALPYLDPTVFLFMGGMCIAAAMQQWGLDRRIALRILRAIGTDPRRLLFGFLVATAFISLWISNTATATMMVPIGLAVIAQLETRGGRGRLVHFGAAIMLSIAYAANVGGIGTKIGTAPNAIFARVMEDEGRPVSFLAFLALGLPFVALMLPVTWLALWRTGRADAPSDTSGGAAIRDELARLGRPSTGERLVLTVFLAAAALWVAGRPIADALRGPLPALGRTSSVEAVVAMAAAVSLVVVRVQGRQALELRSLRKVPWATLLLMGGSFAMAAAIEQSGLSAWIGERLAGLREVPPFVQVLGASLVTVALSAVASNTATITIALNVLRTAVAPAQMPAVLFAATVASSCDFALPAGTPPNAIVFGSGYVTVPRMAKTGALLDVVAAVLAAAWAWLAADAIL